MKTGDTASTIRQESAMNTEQRWQDTLYEILAGFAWLN